MAPVKQDYDDASLTSDDDSKQWREQAHKVANETGRKYQKFYEQFSSNGSTDASNAQTPSRFPLDVVETNAKGAKRGVYVKHRPLRRWMETRGAKGVALRVLSNLQIAGHWGLTIGPYTYEIFQHDKEVVFHVGEWRPVGPGKKSSVKVKEVGCTYMMDLPCLAKAIYQRMKTQGYDKRFNNCHRFANDLAERIATRGDREPITLRMRLLYIWNLLPASHLFQASEFTKQLVRLPKKFLLERVVAELRLYGLMDSGFWRALIKEARISAKVILFLLTVGAMTVFLQMARAFTRWDPENPLHRAEYLKIFECIPGVSEDMARTYLRCAFQGPNALRDVVDSLFQASAKGPKGFFEESFKQLKGVVP
ncbi:hypothetical protein SLS60_005794 [Paraconiothyrium brasiliense]|uniref:PPPDE domain-containing protein n=1 Tax=Paraconiothyrium brasiliense TaxID=300254 RepID=A0ABR3RD81_9PLEO